MDKGETQDHVCKRKNDSYVLRGYEFIRIYEYSNLHATLAYAFTREMLVSENISKAWFPIKFTYTFKI